MWAEEYINPEVVGYHDKRCFSVAVRAKYRFSELKSKWEEIGMN